MNLIPWKNKHRSEDGGEPTSLLALRQEMDRLFDAFIREPFGALDWPRWRQEKLTPPVDIAESENEVTVRAELPGMDPKDLDVQLVGNQLTLAGEKKDSSEQRGENYYHSETRFGSFRRSITLPEGIDSEHVEADYANGILTLRMKKTKPTQTKKIEVKVK
jgi:HSP20 family protein